MLLFGGSLATSVRNVGLVDFWNLEEATAAARVGVKGNSLADSNSVVLDASGIVGGCGQFLAASAKSLTMTLAAATFPTGDFTISCWVNPDSTASGIATYGRGIACNLNGDAAGDWQLAITSAGALRFVHWKSSGTDTTGAHVSTTTPFTDSSWQHALVKCQSGVYSMYRNGVSLAFTDSTSASGWGTLRLRLGLQYNIGGGYMWNGKLDAFGIWSRALSAAEIAYLYNSGAGRQLA